MPVLVEKPESFEIEKFLIAYGSSQTPPLSLINPDTGIEIYAVLANIPIIGLTFQPTPNHSQGLGFIQPSLPNRQDSDQDAPVFEPEALLVLEVDPRSLPTSVKEAWVLQVRNQVDEDAYVTVAKDLSARFGDITIIVTSAHMANPDPALDPGTPVNPKDPKSPLMCPIVIRKTESA